jgi:hypothetical protein
MKVNETDPSEANQSDPREVNETDGVGSVAGLLNEGIAPSC